jgi:hypothetical protein
MSRLVLFASFCFPLINSRAVAVEILGGRIGAVEENGVAVLVTGDFAP